MKAAILLTLLLVYSSSQQDNCCLRKIVEGTDSLDGTYVFIREFDGPKESACVDSCIYSREGPDHEGEEYCFKTALHGATIEDQCEAPSSTTTTTTLMTTPTTSSKPTTNTLELKIPGLMEYLNI